MTTTNTITVSLETLYSIFGRNLKYGVIEHGYQKETDTHYYDLETTSAGIVCMDGEECEVLQILDDRVLLANKAGEEETLFHFSMDEYKALL